MLLFPLIAARERETSKRKTGKKKKVCTEGSPGGWFTVCSSLIRTGWSYVSTHTRPLECGRTDGSSALCLPGTRLYSWGGDAGGDGVQHVFMDKCCSDVPTRVSPTPKYVVWSYNFKKSSGLFRESIKKYLNLWHKQYILMLPHPPRHNKCLANTKFHLAKYLQIRQHI